MYPTIQNAGPLQSNSSTSTSHYYPAVGQLPGSRPLPPVSTAGSLYGTSNGPAQPGSPQNFSLLRVQIADQYRTNPPVMINPGLEDIPRTQFVYSFDFEKKLTAEQEESRRAASSAAASTSTAKAIDDPFSLLLERYTQMGYSREEVAMALAAQGDDKEDQAKVVDFCKAYRELRSMGFNCELAVGALLEHKNDLPAATEACISAAAS
ncbi:hypothetical protein WJX72_012058 [[Myrmecia] bisecta]|uniref:UBA domain-containing protein n=1 Tax=[Myrmecia] bisecta TaxID=41462 RepID=A0AAW1Q1B4_9CHLO